MKILWTDGSANPNPGPGGFAVIEEQPDGSGKPVVLGSEKDSTNIRMEGFAMIAAIKYAADEPCEIHSDSEFWINVLTKWAPTWASNGWQKKAGPIKISISSKSYIPYTLLMMSNSSGPAVTSAPSSTKWPTHGPTKPVVAHRSNTNLSRFWQEETT